MYCTPKQLAPPRKKGGRTHKGDTTRASQSQSKSKCNKKAKVAANAHFEEATSFAKILVSKKPKTGFQSWKDRFNAQKLKRTSLESREWFLFAVR